MVKNGAKNLEQPQQHLSKQFSLNQALINLQSHSQLTKGHKREGDAISAQQKRTSCGKYTHSKFPAAETSGETNVFCNGCFQFANQFISFVDYSQCCINFVPAMQLVLIDGFNGYNETHHFD